MLKALFVVVMGLAAISCGRNDERKAVPTTRQSPATVRSAEARARAQAPAALPIDPKSSQAAVALAQRLADLLNQGELVEAYMLLGPNAPSRAEFESAWKRINNLHATVGKPSDQEGAAGSVYLSIPLDLAGTVHGKPVPSPATIIVRRVNDVSGSTEAQRHWHIQRIDWGNAP